MSPTARCMETIANVQLRHLAELTTVEEVTDAVNNAMEVSVEAKVLLLRANKREQNISTVTLTCIKLSLAWERAH